MKESSIIEQINDEFDVYQEMIDKQEMKLRFFSRISVPDDFYSMIDEITGISELSDKTPHKTS